MRFSTAYNHMTRLKSRLESTFSAAECYKPTHDHLLDQVNEIYKLVPPNCPGWVRQSLADYAESRWDRIQREFVIWLHPTVNGFKTWDLLTEAERAECAKPDYKGNFVWLNETTGRGTIGDRNNYIQGAIIARTFEITGKIYS